MQDEAPPGQRWDPVLQQYTGGEKKVVRIEPGGKVVEETVVTNEMIRPGGRP